MIWHIYFSSVTRSQWKKVIKALIYSFSAGFVGTFALQAQDLITAAHQGRAALTNLAVSLVAGAVIGGLNAIFVTVKQLFTLAPEQQAIGQPVVSPDQVITPATPTAPQTVVAAPVQFTPDDKAQSNIGSTAGS